MKNTKQVSLAGSSVEKTDNIKNHDYEGESL
jgi:hypothetical protein